MPGLCPELGSRFRWDLLGRWTVCGTGAAANAVVLEGGTAMRTTVTGHTSAHVFRHYDIGDVDSLRDKLARRRAYVADLPNRSKVVQLAEHRGA